jgi:flagellar M-ring protein FliF
VVVNQRKDVDKDGKPSQQADPDAEIKQINELVKEAMGFNKDRGDTCRSPTPRSPQSRKSERTAALEDPEMHFAMVKDTAQIRSADRRHLAYPLLKRRPALY